MTTEEKQPTDPAWEQADQMERLSMLADGQFEDGIRAALFHVGIPINRHDEIVGRIMETRKGEAA